MYRLGRKQELKRRFKYCQSSIIGCPASTPKTDFDAVSIAGYVVVLGNTWEFAIVTSTFGLANGGTAGTIWMSIVVCIGMMFGVLSLAEVSLIENVNPVHH